MQRRGFTLIELFTVLAVLITLIALMYPLAQRNWSDGAKRIRCPSNLRQLATAASMYATDYDNRYPQAGLSCKDPTRPDGSPGCEAGALVRHHRGQESRQHGERYGYGETWQGGGLANLYPYTKSWGIYWCPRMAEGFPSPTDPKSYYNGFEWLKSPERVRFPEYKVLMLEAYSFHEEDRKRVRRLDDPPNPERRFYVAFVDGHVKAMDLSTGCSANYGDSSCIGWESCSGPGDNGNYICSGFGRGVDVPDFPTPRLHAPIDVFPSHLVPNSR